MKLVQRAAFLVSCLVLVFCLGCGSKVNQGNYDKLKQGMTFEEVKSILGAPTTEGGGGIASLTGKSCEWKDGDKSIKVVFVNDKSMPPMKSGF